VRSPSQSHTPVKDQAPRNKSHSDADITAEQFIHQFEALLTSFATANQLAKDFTWERLLVHSLPPEQKEWFNQNLKGSNLSWAAAKRLFLEEFGTGMRHSMKPNPSLEKRAQSTKPDTSLNRKAQYAQALLTLEMQDNDDLKEFNEKFKRYSDSAGMTCDYSLLKRYVNSLAQRFRALAAPLLSMPELANNLAGLMEQVEKLEQPSPGLVEADKHCSHHRDSTGFKSAWPTVAGPLKRRAVDSTFEAVEKRVKYQPVA
jgi:hypothetical protein